jgi:Leucine-rich repeat (LRR) protein
MFKVNALITLDLADNLMGKIPFVPISHVKTLKSLDMSNNRIEKVEDPFFTSETLRLDQLYLMENNIETLPSMSFANFDFINYTSLAGNPLRMIDDEAFRDAQIRRLDLSNCLLHDISAKAFKGLERNLEMVDLSANRLKDLPDTLFDDFDLIKKLKLSDNMLSLSPNVSFNGFRYTIKDLDLLGEDMHYVPINEIGIMRNLRTVGLAAVKDYGQVTSDEFKDFAPGLEELSLVSAGISKIDKNAFAHVPSVSSMDLSNNKIGSISDEAFKDVGNALRYLKMSNALYFTRLPNMAFHSLSAMITLDLSDNHIRDIPLDTFHKMSKLKFLYLQVYNYTIMVSMLLNRV